MHDLADHADCRSGVSDGALFAVMDMNLPEGFLLAQLRERSPAPSNKQRDPAAGQPQGRLSADDSGCPCPRPRAAHTDDGKGIDPKVPIDDGHEGHYGSRGMRETRGKVFQEVNP
jgi:hypothetical protein